MPPIQTGWHSPRTAEACLDPGALRLPVSHKPARPRQAGACPDGPGFILTAALSFTVSQKQAAPAQLTPNAQAGRALSPLATPRPPAGSLLCVCTDEEAKSSTHTKSSGSKNGLGGPCFQLLAKECGSHGNHVLERHGRKPEVCWGHCARLPGTVPAAPEAHPLTPGSVNGIWQQCDAGDNHNDSHHEMLTFVTHSP